METASGTTVPFAFIFVDDQISEQMKEPTTLKCLFHANECVPIGPHEVLDDIFGSNATGAFLNVTEKYGTDSLPPRVRRPDSPQSVSHYSGRW